ncbi:SRPBCC family protein [Streptosporangium sp. NPDC005286]|uniref:SRPBCC family protein n=1 Tax=Streptosporangium sp. NPDC005286 TaxID=3154463 RepID=UPI0033BEC00C
MVEEHEYPIPPLVRALGWTSLGLGVAQLAAPGAVSRLAGVDDSPKAFGAVVLVGVRELFHAATLLSSRDPAPWVWARVAGDALDLALLGRAIAGRTGWRRGRVTAVAATVAVVTAADLCAAIRASRHRPEEGSARWMSLHAAVTINRPREDVYRYWRDFENLPRFMAHLESVRTIGDGRSHWKVKGPAKKAIEWEAVIVEDRSGEVITWRSTGKATVDNSGSVRFTDAPGGRGTEVRVNLRYAPPGGKVGAAFARLLGEHPEQQVRDDLRRFKQVMETGEVVRSEGSLEGAHALRHAVQRPAQPVMSGSAS